MSEDRKDKEMICGLTADERDLLQLELSGLPEVMPPRAVWDRIREQADAEGLLRRGVLRRPMTWNGGLGLAAAVALVVVLLPVLLNSPDTPLGVTEPPITVDTGAAAQVNALQALMVESRQLERDLRALPQEPRVGKAGTVATISEIEDRIAAIDYQLNDPAVTMTPEDEEIFWRERVRLMKLLVGLRYAQAHRSGY